MSDDASASLGSRLSKLNVFSKLTGDDDDEEFGEKIDFESLAGGGRAGRRTAITTGQLRVSNALRHFLVDKKVLTEAEAAVDSDQSTPALEALVQRPHIEVPAILTDRSFTLAEYFVSSSHNTYLMAHQLFGKSSAAAYERALRTGARCVEIDAWDSDDKEEPKVTHGYTLVSHISFRAVCETIRDVMDQEAAEAVDEQGYRAAPLLLSLENHCSPYGQLRLVSIMKEVFGDRLLSKAVRSKGHHEQDGADEHVRLDELGSKVCVIVEWHGTNEAMEEDDLSESSEDEEEKRTHQKYREQKAAAASNVIIPELAELGVYAQSVKPPDNSWFEEAEWKREPHHHLINVSETQLLANMPANNQKIARHNASALVRVFPKGTRISSKNLKPVSFWAIGSQICALNWQTFGSSMQTNEALFSGTDGYVLKPAALRPGGNGQLNTGQRRRLRLKVAGATDIPLPPGRDADIKPYLTCSLIHPNDQNGATKRKTGHYHQHKLGFLHRGENPPPDSPVWDEELSWDYDDNEMCFIRLIIKSDDSFARNPTFCVAAVRLLYIRPGEWNFIRMLDLKGAETRCSLLVKFEFEDI
ncbi:1-phosphatidylinositol-4-5-bisphosphate phosphodiesterase [Apiospora kogelbergensis]|uniref:Phosphoinositide phospholipase C n=1 Tax=Apiospora kogelbergensis TaxID=1337665 RepID=A0AAW0QUQ6_9PEZI